MKTEISVFGSGPIYPEPNPYPYYPVWEPYPQYPKPDPYPYPVDW